MVAEEILSVMNILMITANDPAGMGIAFSNAINHHSGNRSRLITTETRYNFEFEKDIHVPDLNSKEYGKIEELLQWADIFHFHILSDENMMLGPFLIRDYCMGKAIVHHHHGHPYFMANSSLFREKYRGLKRKTMVSTPNLLRLLPESTWVPNLVPIHDVDYRPLTDKKIERHISVGHSPTRQDLKRTDLFEELMEEIMVQYPDVRKKIITNTLHRMCLKLKRECSIFFDQLGPSFGVSSLEALSQGVPVLARLDDLNIDKIKGFTHDPFVPWINVRDKRSLKKEIVTLCKDREYRLNMGKRSRQFMERSWSEEKVLEVLFKVYEEL